VELFTQNDIENYKVYFNNRKVLEAADKIFEAVKKENDLSNDNEKMASAVLAYMKLKEYYSKKANIT